MSTRALASHGGHEGGKFFGWRPPLQCEREAFVVVVSFPSSEANGGRREIIESPAPPELRLVDSVTAFDLPVLLGAPGPDVAMSNPQRLEGKGRKRTETRGRCRTAASGSERETLGRARRGMRGLSSGAVGDKAATLESACSRRARCIEMPTAQQFSRTSRRPGPFRPAQPFQRARGPQLPISSRLAFDPDLVA